MILPKDLLADFQNLPVQRFGLGIVAQDIVQHREELHAFRRSQVGIAEELLANPQGLFAQRQAFTVPAESPVLPALAIKLVGLDQLPGLVQRELLESFEISDIPLRVRDSIIVLVVELLPELDQFPLATDCGSPVGAARVLAD